MKRKSPTRKNADRRVELSNALKLQGYCVWMNIGGDGEGSAQRFEVQTAILREGGNEIAIDCNCAAPGDDPYVYTILIRRESHLLFRGEWVAGNTTDRSTGICSSRVYSNGSHLALIGSWTEDGIPQQWLAELHPSAAQ